LARWFGGPPPAALDDRRIRLQQSKTGRSTVLPAGGPLKALLDRTKVITGPSKRSISSPRLFLPRTVGCCPRSVWLYVGGLSDLAPFLPLTCEIGSELLWRSAVDVDRELTQHALNRGILQAFVHRGV
jgi:hypothetical protein